MKNKILFALFTALMAAALVVGCSNFAGPDDAKAPAGKGTLSLSVQGLGAGRTIMPLLTYEATISKTGAADIQATLIPGVNIIALTPGTYTVNVNAYNGGTTVVATGKAENVTIVEGEGVAASITIEPTDEVSAASKGTFTWNLSDFTGSVKVSVYKLEDVEVPGVSVTEIQFVASPPETLLGASNGQTAFGNYAELKAYTIPSTIVKAGYNRLQFDLDTYKWDWTDPDDHDKGGDFVLDINNSQNSNNIGYKLKKDGANVKEEWNAPAGNDGKVFTWALPAEYTAADFTTGTWTVVISHKTQATHPISKIVVNSVKFLVDPSYTSASTYYPNIDDLATLTAEQTLATTTGSQALDGGEYFLVFEAGGVKWNEVLFIVPGVTSDYAPSFADIFQGTPGNLTDSVLASFAKGSYAIHADEFGPLGLNISGSNAANVNSAIAAILKAPTTNPVPTTAAGLKELIDAALILSSGAGITATVSDVANTIQTAAAETSLKNLVKNSTSTTATEFAWTSAADEKGVVEASVVVTKIGAGNYSVTIAPLESFYLTLASAAGVTTSASAFPDSPPNKDADPDTGKYPNGKIDLKENDGIAVTFKSDAQVNGAYAQSVFFPLTAAQIAKVKAAKSLVTNIDGTCDSTTFQFRSCVGDPSQGTWNQTAMIAGGNNVFSALTGSKTITITSPGNGTYTHLILQKRSAGEATVTINAIKISLVY